MYRYIWLGLAAISVSGCGPTLSERNWADAQKQCQLRTSKEQQQETYDDCVKSNFRAYEILSHYTPPPPPRNLPRNHTPRRLQLPRQPRMIPHPPHPPPKHTTRRLQPPRQSRMIRHRCRTSYRQPSAANRSLREWGPPKPSAAS